MRLLGREGAQQPVVTQELSTLYRSLPISTDVPALFQCFFAGRSRPFTRVVEAGIGLHLYALLREQRIKIRDPLGSEDLCRSTGIDYATVSLVLSGMFELGKIGETVLPRLARALNTDIDALFDLVHMNVIRKVGTKKAKDYGYKVLSRLLSDDQVMNPETYSISLMMGRSFKMRRYVSGNPTIPGNTKAEIGLRTGIHAKWIECLEKGLVPEEALYPNVATLASAFRITPEILHAEGESMLRFRRQ